jgi:hypothetical protein
MSQITIRMIPANVESRIRRIAMEKRISLSAAAILILQSGLGLEPNSEKKRDLSCVFGTWSQAEAAEFAEATSQFDRIDREVWD